MRDMCKYQVPTIGIPQFKASSLLKSPRPTWWLLASHPRDRDRKLRPDPGSGLQRLSLMCGSFGFQLQSQLCLPFLLAASFDAHGAGHAGGELTSIGHRVEKDANISGNSCQIMLVGVLVIDLSSELSQIGPKAVGNRGQKGGSQKSGLAR